MKTLLKIDITDNGLSFAECDLENELDIKRLISSLLVLMAQNKNLKDAILSSVALMLQSPEDVEKLTEASLISAQQKIFSRDTNNSKN